MKKLLTIITALSVLLTLAACGGYTDKGTSVDNGTSVSDANEPSQQEEAQSERSAAEENGDMLKIKIITQNKTFTATLYHNEAAKALIDMLPLTLHMSELNGNEKYYYLDSSLPANASKPAGIKAGDIMLYGSSCLVLFYKSFSTSYSYTPIGHIDDPEGLAEALGSGSVQISFKKG